MQDRAIAPAPAGRRKVVLATSIAETSLTIEGVRIVVDSGLARVPRYEPDVGLTRLETVRVSRAAADQRRGRAGRIEPGVCYRLWDEPQTAVARRLTPSRKSSPPTSRRWCSISRSGASPIPATLVFLDPPPIAALAEAKSLLADLGAIDGDGRITDEGQGAQSLPLPPRLARMVIDAGREGAGRAAAEIAAVLTERGLGGNDVDLEHRLDALRRDRSARGEEAKRMARRWAESAAAALPTAGSEPASGPRPDGTLSTGAILALAYPERIAKSRGGGNGAFLLANGRGANIDPASPLAREPFLAVAEIIGSAAQGRIMLAAAIGARRHRGALRRPHRDARGDHLRSAERSRCAAGAPPARRHRARRAGRAGRPRREHGSACSPKRSPPPGSTACRGRSRCANGATACCSCARAEGDEWPDLSDAALAASVGEWLAPLFADKTALAGLGADEFEAALHGLLPHTLRRRLEAEAPTHFDAPSGSRVPIEYEAEGPKLAIRVQELFGLDRHPSVARGRVPLVIELLSPAHRPVQVTRDLPDFWRGSYAAVRADLRGRYPRHPWPEDPLSAPATRRAKPRGQ